MDFVVLAMSAVSLTALFMGGDACDKVPTMTWSDACLNVSTTPAMYNLCQETLQHAPDAAEVTVYAAAAAEAAKASYGATASAAEKLLLFGPPLREEERPAIRRCLYESSVASGYMVHVVMDMNACSFKNTVEEYSYSVLSIESCRRALSDFPQSPLVAMNAADRDVTRVAIRLGSLVFSR